MLKTNKPIALVALLKRVTRVIRSRRSLPKERKEGFALLKEPISLFLFKNLMIHTKNQRAKSQPCFFPRGKELFHINLLLHVNIL